MGFSHDLITRHFQLLKDGGEIAVTANDPKDTASIEQIRMHLSHIASMFSNGNFNAPMVIHDRPPKVNAIDHQHHQIQIFQTSLAQRPQLIATRGHELPAHAAFLDSVAFTTLSAARR
jgi:hypothetical protein